ncbi:MAG: DUF2135 domain-containing protein [Gammaproteobacteria bacterium]
MTMFKTLPAALLLAGGFAPPALAAGFDCAKAGNEIETAICADSRLSAADETLAELYERLVWLTSGDKAGLQQLAAEQKDWLQKQRNVCREVACIAEAYYRRQIEIEQQISAYSRPAPLVPGKAELDAPLGGWRNSFDEPMRYVQKVTYPAADVNAGEEDGSLALIKGRIVASPKSGNELERPLKLVVNGVAMPLKTDGGEFERPYAFGAGSNSVEILSPDGKSLARTQFFESYREKPSPKLRVVLSWDSDGTDVDLHVVTPDGQHGFYGNRVLANGGALDVDATTGYGPEIFSMPAILPGTYLVYVNYYGGYDSEDELTTARIAVVTDEGTPDEKMQTLTVPLRHPGDLMLVHAFTYP